MPDMLVNLLKLPPIEPLLSDLREKGISIRRARTFEQSILQEFILEHFAHGWADEITVGFSRQPVSIFLATKEGQILGFGGYECTARAFFGPTGVQESARGIGIGKALLIACLQGLSEMGYVYGVIGGVGPSDFYRRAVGAMIIPDSTPGLYTDLLHRTPRREP